MMTPGAVELRHDHSSYELFCLLLSPAVCPSSIQSSVASPRPVPSVLPENLPLTRPGQLLPYFSHTSFLFAFVYLTNGDAFPDTPLPAAQ